MTVIVLLKTKQVAKILGMQVIEVRELLLQGKLRGLKYSPKGDWHILSCDLERFMSQAADNAQRAIWDRRFKKEDALQTG